METFKFYKVFISGIITAKFHVSFKNREINAYFYSFESIEVMNGKLRLLVANGRQSF